MLFHRDLGGAGNPPLVLLHGMLGSSRNWLTAGRELAAHFEVVALDLRNHGSSPHAGSMTYEEMMEDVLGWLDQRSWARVTLLGHSLGGKVGMMLACRHPRRMKRLIVVDIAPRDYDWPGHRQSFAAMNALELRDLHSRAEAELRLEGRVTSGFLRKFLVTNLERDRAGRWRWQINLPVLTASLETLQRNPLRTEDRFEGPTRFIVGGKSDYVEPADHGRIRAHFPAAEIVVMENSGHNPHIETRAEFLDAVVAGVGSGQPFSPRKPG